MGVSDDEMKGRDAAMRNMSFALTTEAFLAGRKTVTRRLGWAFLKPGDRVCAVERCMGLKAGEKVRRLAELEIVSNRAEPLEAMTEEDVGLEGFEKMTAAEFVAFFCREAGKAKRVTPGTVVQRVEFRVVRWLE